MAGFWSAFVKLNSVTNKSVDATQHTLIRENLCPEVCSSLSSVSTNHEEMQKKHWCNEMHTNLHKFPRLSPGFMASILSSVMVNLWELGHCCLEFLTIEVSLVCHVPFPNWPFRRQITELSNATIDQEIQVLGAGVFLVDGSELGNLPDVLSHCIICPLCSQATLILPNPHGFCCTLTDCNTGIPGPDTDWLSYHLDCITICDDWFRQLEGITLHCRLSTVVSNWVVDIKWLLL